jgi:hypothetical protein
MSDPARRTLDRRRNRGARRHFSTCCEWCGASSKDRRAMKLRHKDTGDRAVLILYSGCRTNRDRTVWLSFERPDGEAPS